MKIKMLVYLIGMSYSYSENHYNESKDQEEETVLEEIMRKAAIGRYVVYYWLLQLQQISSNNEIFMCILSIFNSYF